MSLTIDIRAADGTSSATVTSVGQVLTLQVIGIITAGVVNPANNDQNISVGQPATYGIDEVTGSLLSTGLYSGSVDGNLADTIPQPFKANAYQAGTLQDLNGDGNIDIGSNNPNLIEGYFFPRHGGYYNNGTVSGNTMVIDLATLTYTVTNLASGGETDINFVPRPEAGARQNQASWFDGVQYDYNPADGTGAYASNFDNVFQAGTPFVVKNTSLNPPPVVNTDNLSVVRNNPLQVNLLTNVTTSDALVTSSVTIVSQPTHGTLSNLSNGSITYTPNTGYLGTDSFTYHVTDSNGNTSNTGPVDINVTTPPPPVAVADTATTLRGQAVTVSVLANDTDAAPSATITPSTLAIVTNGTDGTAVLNPAGDGTIIYTPNAGFVGTDTFTYTVADSLGETSAPGTVTVTVTAPVPPVAVDDTATNLEAHASTLSVLANDTTESVAIDPTTVVIGTAPAHGSAVPQADGTVIYTSTPGYTGTDSFTYTVNDILGDVSNAATVTLTVTPVVPPTAADDTASDVESQPVTINVLSNDTAQSVPLDPTKVLIGTAPTSGTAVPQADGTIIYTSNAGFVGTDSFTYTVDNQYGDPSNSATVTVTVTAAPAPTANSFTTPITAVAGTPIDVLSNVTSVGELVPSSVAVTTAAGHGSTSIDTTTGAITYVPGPDFVGIDTFQYTVADVNGNTSAPATVSVQVGTTLSSAKGGNKSITFLDAAGTTETATLNVGTANLIFSGSGTATTKAGKVSIAGTNLQITGITLTGTTKASSLVLRSIGNKAFTIGAITDTAALSSINARTATITGAIDVSGLTSLTLGGLSDATVTIGTTGAKQATLSLGSVADSSVTSSIPLSSLSVASWSGNGSTGTANELDVPSIVSITSKGDFVPVINRVGVGSITGGIGSAHIAGLLASAWDVSGSVGTIVAGSVSSNWSGTLGSLAAMTIKGGGLSSPLRTGKIGTLTIVGDLTSTVIAQSIRALRVSGSISGATLYASGAAGIGQIVAASMVNSTISAGLDSVPSFADAAAANLGTATIGSLTLTGRTGDQFTNSSVFAGKIRSASVGSITTTDTDTNGNPVAEGIATTSIANFSGIFGANAIRLNRSQLASEALLQAYITQQAISLGDFQIDIV